MDETRAKGLAKMKEVYGWDMPDLPGDYFALTADHLFADIWSRPGLTMRDKRIMTLSVVTALGLSDLAEIQVNAALRNQEMTAEELREMAVFITHYVGFPLGSGLNGVIERVIAKRKGSAGGVGGKKANTDAVVAKHKGS